jgi:YidC/Oxa1 family membrane protein insertase
MRAMTDNVRVFLWVSLLAMLWLNYTVWVKDHPSVAPITEQPTPQSGNAGVPAPPELPTAGRSTAAAPPAVPTAPSAAAEAGAAPPTSTVHVRTDVLDVLIDTHGGDLVRADLPRYPVDKHDPSHVVRLLDFGSDDRWVFHTGLRQVGGGEEPNHLAQYHSASQEYVLAPGQDQLVVTLDWVGPGPVTARKVYTFRRGQYDVDLELELTNGGSTPWQGAGYTQLDRIHHPVARHYASVESYSFRGPVLYDGDRYHKLKVEDLATDPIDETITNGWVASIQHHFLAAAVPPPGEPAQYQAVTHGNEYLLTAVSDVHEVAPGGQLKYPIQLFVGPKLQRQLAATANGLELTVDYGVLTVLAQPLFWLLSKVHAFVGNWGLSIILVTLLIKLAFYKLTQTSGRSMAKMRQLAPRLKALQERHKDDRQALSAAMMDLYKREKVNPAAGCLPMVVQMPFFFAFYWVLVESVEMRQAPFMLWIDDLSSRDPYFVLPLLMGAAMLLQSRLNPAPPDPVQARVMQIMPLVFTGMFAFFPSGLVLYWLTNTALSMLQQWRINKLIAAEQR